MSNEQFRRDMRRIIDKAKNRNDELICSLCLDAYSRLVLKSPVATGRFKANWQVGYNSPDTTTTLETDKSGSTAIAKATVELKDSAGQIVFLTNSLPYAKRLEDGHSQAQAPFGMVKLTVEELQPTITKIARELRYS
jgi:hypothetical protein